MNKKILAFGASNSKQSINRQFAQFAAQRICQADVELLDLNDYEMPIYSIDREKEEGVPMLAHDFLQKIEWSEGIVISFAEHNGAYTVAFKNIFDWVSRIDSSVWKNRPMLLLSTSPGGRGGKAVLEIATNKFRFVNKNSVSSFSLPSFRQNFDPDQGIVNAELKNGFLEQLAVFEDALIGQEITVEDR